MFEVYATDEKKKIASIDTINKAVTHAELSNDKSVLKQALCLRIDYYEKNKRSVYAALDRDRIATF